MVQRHDKATKMMISTSYYWVGKKDSEAVIQYHLIFIKQCQHFLYLCVFVYNFISIKKNIIGYVINYIFGSLEAGFRMRSK